MKELYTDDLDSGYYVKHNGKGLWIANLKGVDAPTMWLWTKHPNEITHIATYETVDDLRQNYPELFI